jgi:phosphomevalonate kinase
VAACFAGGLVRYRRYDVQGLLDAARTGALQSSLGAAAPVDLFRTPQLKLPLAYAFTGKSASTRLMIADIERRLDEAARQRFTLASDGLGRELEDALVKGDFAAAQEAVPKLQALLGSLGQVTTEDTERLLRLGQSFNCPGKISGAGGGDGCIFICPDEPTRATFLEALVARGIHAMAVPLEEGLRGEPRGDPALQRWLT